MILLVSRCGTAVESRGVRSGLALASVAQGEGEVRGVTRIGMAREARAGDRGRPEAAGGAGPLAGSRPEEKRPRLRDVAVPDCPPCRESSGARPGEGRVAMFRYAGRSALEGFRAGLR